MTSISGAELDAQHGFPWSCFSCKSKNSKELKLCGTCGIAKSKWTFGIQISDHIYMSKLSTAVNGIEEVMISRLVPPPVINVTMALPRVSEKFHVCAEAAISSFHNSLKGNEFKDEKRLPLLNDNPNMSEYFQIPRLASGDSIATGLSTLDDRPLVTVLNPSVPGPITSNQRKFSELSVGSDTSGSLNGYSKVRSRTHQGQESNRNSSQNSSSTPKKKVNIFSSLFTPTVKHNDPRGSSSPRRIELPHNGFQGVSVSSSVGGTSGKVSPRFPKRGGDVSPREGVNNAEEWKHRIRMQMDLKTRNADISNGASTGGAVSPRRIQAPDFGGGVSPRRSHGSDHGGAVSPRRIQGPDFGGGVTPRRRADGASGNTGMDAFRRGMLGDTNGAVSPRRRDSSDNGATSPRNWNPDPFNIAFGRRVYPKRPKPTNGVGGGTTEDDSEQLRSSSVVGSANISKDNLGGGDRADPTLRPPPQQQQQQAGQVGSLQHKLVTSLIGNGTTDPSTAVTPSPPREPRQAVSDVPPPGRVASARRQKPTVPPPSSAVTAAAPAAVVPNTTPVNRVVVDTVLTVPNPTPPTDFMPHDIHTNSHTQSLFPSSSLMMSPSQLNLDEPRRKYVQLQMPQIKPVKNSVFSKAGKLEIERSMSNFFTHEDHEMSSMMIRKRSSNIFDGVMPHPEQSVGAVSSTVRSGVDTGLSTLPEQQEDGPDPQQVHQHPVIALDNGDKRGVLTETDQQSGQTVEPIKQRRKIEGHKPHFDTLTLASITTPSVQGGPSSDGTNNDSPRSQASVPSYLKPTASSMAAVTNGPKSPRNQQVQEPKSPRQLTQETAQQKGTGGTTPRSKVSNQGKMSANVNFQDASSSLNGPVTSDPLVPSTPQGAPTSERKPQKFSFDQPTASSLAASKAPVPSSPRQSQPMSQTQNTVVASTKLSNGVSSPRSQAGAPYKRESDSNSTSTSEPSNQALQVDKDMAPKAPRSISTEGSSAAADEVKKRKARSVSPAKASAPTSPRSEDTSSVKPTVPSKTTTSSTPASIRPSAPQAVSIAGAAVGSKAAGGGNSTPRGRSRTDSRSQGQEVKSDNETISETTPGFVPELHQPASEENGSSIKESAIDMPIDVPKEDLITPSAITESTPSVKVSRTRAAVEQEMLELFGPTTPTTTETTVVKKVTKGNKPSAPSSPRSGDTSSNNNGAKPTVPIKTTTASTPASTRPSAPQAVSSAGAAVGSKAAGGGSSTPRGRSRTDSRTPSLDSKSITGPPQPSSDTTSGQVSLFPLSGSENRPIESTGATLDGGMNQTASAAAVQPTVGGVAEAVVTKSTPSVKVSRTRAAVEQEMLELFGPTTPTTTETTVVKKVTKGNKPSAPSSPRSGDTSNNNGVKPTAPSKPTTSATTSSTTSKPTVPPKQPSQTVSSATVVAGSKAAGGGNSTPRGREAKNGANVQAAPIKSTQATPTTPTEDPSILPEPVVAAEKTVESLSLTITQTQESPTASTTPAIIDAPTGVSDTVEVARQTVGDSGTPLSLTSNPTVIESSATVEAPTPSVKVSRTRAAVEQEMLELFGPTTPTTTETTVVKKVTKGNKPSAPSSPRSGDTGSNNNGVKPTAPSKTTTATTPTSSGKDTEKKKQTSATSTPAGKAVSRPTSSLKSDQVAVVKSSQSTGRPVAPVNSSDSGPIRTRDSGLSSISDDSNQQPNGQTKAPSNKPRARSLIEDELDSIFGPNANSNAVTVTTNATQPSRATSPRNKPVTDSKPRTASAPKTASTLRSTSPSPARKTKSVAPSTPTKESEAKTGSTASRGSQDVDGGVKKSTIIDGTRSLSGPSERDNISPIPPDQLDDLVDMSQTPIEESKIFESERHPADQSFESTRERVAIVDEGNMLVSSVTSDDYSAVMTARHNKQELDDPDDDPIRGRNEGVYPSHKEMFSDDSHSSQVEVDLETDDRPASQLFKPTAHSRYTNSVDDKPMEPKVGRRASLDDILNEEVGEQDLQPDADIKVMTSIDDIHGTGYVDSPDKFSSLLNKGESVGFSSDSASLDREEVRGQPSDKFEDYEVAYRGLVEAANALPDDDDNRNQGELMTSYRIAAGEQVVASGKLEKEAEIVTGEHEEELEEDLEHHSSGDSVDEDLDFQYGFVDKDQDHVEEEEDNMFRDIDVDDEDTADKDDSGWSNVDVGERNDTGEKGIEDGQNDDDSIGYDDDFDVKDSSGVTDEEEYPPFDWTDDNKPNQISSQTSTSPQKQPPGGGVDASTGYEEDFVELDSGDRGGYNGKNEANIQKVKENDKKRAVEKGRHAISQHDEIDDEIEESLEENLNMDEEEEEGNSYTWDGDDDTATRNKKQEPQRVIRTSPAPTQSSPVPKKETPSQETKKPFVAPVYNNHDDDIDEDIEESLETGHNGGDDEDETPIVWHDDEDDKKIKRRPKAVVITIPITPPAPVAVLTSPEQQQPKKVLILKEDSNDDDNDDEVVENLYDNEGFDDADDSLHADGVITTPDPGYEDPPEYVKEIPRQPSLEELMKSSPGRRLQWGLLQTREFCKSPSEDIHIEEVDKEDDDDDIVNTDPLIVYNTAINGGEEPPPALVHIVQMQKAATPVVTVQPSPPLESKGSGGRSGQTVHFETSRNGESQDSGREEDDKAPNEKKKKKKKSKKSSSRSRSSDESNGDDDDDERAGSAMDSERSGSSLGRRSDSRQRSSSRQEDDDEDEDRPSSRGTSKNRRRKKKSRKSSYDDDSVSVGSLDDDSVFSDEGYDERSSSSLSRGRGSALDNERSGSSLGGRDSRQRADRERSGSSLGSLQDIPPLNKPADTSEKKKSSKKKSSKSRSRVDDNDDDDDHDNLSTQSVNSSDRAWQADHRPQSHLSDIPELPGRPSSRSTSANDFTSSRPGSGLKDSSASSSSGKSKNSKKKSKSKSSRGDEDDDEGEDSEEEDGISRSDNNPSKSLLGDVPTIQKPTNSREDESFETTKKSSDRGVKGNEESRVSVPRALTPLQPLSSSGGSDASGDDAEAEERSSSAARKSRKSKKSKNKDDGKKSVQISIPDSVESSQSSLLGDLPSFNQKPGSKISNSAPTPPKPKKHKVEEDDDESVEDEEEEGLYEAESESEYVKPIPVLGDEDTRATRRLKWGNLITKEFIRQLSEEILDIPDYSRPVDLEDDIVNQDPLIIRNTAINSGETFIPEPVPLLSTPSSSSSLSSGSKGLTPSSAIASQPTMLASYPDVLGKPILGKASLSPLSPLSPLTAPSSFESTSSNENDSRESSQKKKKKKKKKSVIDDVGGTRDDDSVSVDNDNISQTSSIDSDDSYTKRTPRIPRGKPTDFSDFGDLEALLSGNSSKPTTNISLNSGETFIPEPVPLLSTPSSSSSLSSGSKGLTPSSAIASQPTMLASYPDVLGKPILGKASLSPLSPLSPLTAPSSFESTSSNENDSRESSQKKKKKKKSVIDDVGDTKVTLWTIVTSANPRP